MTGWEITKVIADFMEVPRCKCCDAGHDGLSRSIHFPCGKCGNPHLEANFNYTQSLDALVPVWEKFGEIPIMGRTNKGNFVSWFHMQMVTKCVPNESLQFAAAEATAKAIMHMNKTL